jgi:hypothetical protein
MAFILVAVAVWFAGDPAEGAAGLEARRSNYAGNVPSVLSPAATTRSISSGGGLCNAMASSTGPVSHVSQSSAAVKTTGIAFA